MIATESAGTGEALQAHPPDAAAPGSKETIGGKRRGPRPFPAGGLTAPPGIRTPDPLIKSRDLGSASDSGGGSGQHVTAGECECTETHETPEKGGDSSPAESTAKASEAHGGDSDRPGSGRRSDKQTDKQNDKRAFVDPGLGKVADAWPDLPDPIKAAILAMIDTTTEAKGGPAARRGKE